MPTIETLTKAIPNIFSSICSAGKNQLGYISPIKVPQALVDLFEHCRPYSQGSWIIPVALNKDYRMQTTVYLGALSAAYVAKRYFQVEFFKASSKSQQASSQGQREFRVGLLPKGVDSKITRWTSINATPLFTQVIRIGKWLEGNDFDGRQNARYDTLELPLTNSDKAEDFTRVKADLVARFKCLGQEEDKKFYEALEVFSTSFQLAFLKDLLCENDTQNHVKKMAEKALSKLFSSYSHFELPKDFHKCLDKVSCPDLLKQIQEALEKKASDSLSLTD